MGTSEQPHAILQPNSADVSASVEPVQELAPSASEAAPPAEVTLMKIPPRPKSAEAELLPDPEDRLNHRSPDQLDKARKRQAVFLQKRRKQKKRQVLLARMRGLLRVGFALFLIVGLYLLQWLPIWHVAPQGVQIDGIELLQARHLDPIMASTLQKPLYQINPMALETQIKHQVSLVDDVHIRRRLFPAGLLISVVEKPYWAALHTSPQSGPQYWLHTDGSMTPVSQFYKAGKDPLPSAARSVKIYGNLANLNTKQRKRFQTLVETLTLSAPHLPLRALDVRDPQEVWAILDGYTARLGKADALLLERSRRLLDVAPALASRQASIHYVDLRWNNQILLKLKTPEQIKQEAERKAREAKQLAEKKRQPKAAKALPTPPASESEGPVTTSRLNLPPSEAVKPLAKPPVQPHQTR